MNKKYKLTKVPKSDPRKWIIKVKRKLKSNPNKWA